MLVASLYEPVRSTCNIENCQDKDWMAGLRVSMNLVSHAYNKLYYHHSDEWAKNVQFQYVEAALNSQRCQTYRTALWSYRRDGDLSNRRWPPSTLE